MINVLKHTLADTAFATQDIEAAVNQVMPQLAMMTQHLHILTPDLPP